MVMGVAGYFVNEEEFGETRRGGRVI